MVKQLSILVLLLFSDDLIAQINLDSLFQVWEDATYPDSDRVDAYQQYIANGHFYTNPDSAIILIEELVDFSDSISYEIGVIDASILLGYTYFRMGSYPKALATYRDALRVAESIKDTTGIARIHLRMGFLYHDNEDLITALQHYQKSLRLFELLDNRDGMGSVFNEFGSIYRAKGEFDKSLEYYNRSIEINREIGDEDGSSAMYNNIGRAYLEQGRYEEAITNFEKSLAIDSRKGDQLGIASCYAGLGTVYREQGDMDKALEFLQRSLTISESIDDAQGAGNTLLELGSIFIELDRHRQAIRSCERAKVIGERLGDVGNQEASCACLYESHKALGQTEQALRYFEQTQIFYDSMQSEATAIQLQQMEFSKQATIDSLARAEQEMQIQLAHQQEVQRKDRNRNLALGAGFFFLLLAGGFFSRWRYVKKSKAIIEKEKERSENLLLNILPAEIAEELKEKGEAAARDFDLVSILFTDFKEFTEKSAALSASQLINEINHCFRAFDYICEQHSIEKIKTIGDAYMAAGGLPVATEASVENTVMAALEMQRFMVQRATQNRAAGQVAFEMRVGIHTGPVVAGIVGVKKFQYDVWGDTVNTASRMESNGQVGQVNISDSTYDLIKTSPRFSFVKRNAIPVKGKGDMVMWFVSDRTLSAV